MITNLSFPSGKSINNGIDPAQTSMAYTTVDEVTAQALAGTLLANVDIESAYRLIPVLPQDRTLQGVKWKGAIYMDSMLPFGLRTWKEGTAIHAYI